MSEPVLSILIPTLRSRVAQLGALLIHLEAQIRAWSPRPQVEVLIDEDAGEKSVGAKRQKLLSEAQGRFIVFVDDDDEVADDYVSTILSAITSDPGVDCVGFLGMMTADGGAGRQVRWSLDVRSPELSEGVYLRRIGHLNPVRRSIAIKHAFRDLRSGEDEDWSRRVSADLRAQVFMDRVLYHYRYRSDRTATQNGKAAPTVMGIDPSIFHVVIPSAKPANLRACVRSIMTLDPGIHPSRIVVVDDGASAEGTRQEFPMLSWLPGKKPFVFARNVNLALSGLSGDAVVLNDDARLMTRFGLSALSYTARAHANLGIVSARVLEGQLRNPYEAPGGMAPEEWTMFPFVCTYLKRRTIERVGFLDERFTGYGYDDNDYCLRVRQVGLKLGQYNGCSVLHGDQQTSTYRQMHDFATLYETNRRIYEAKWARKT